MTLLADVGWRDHRAALWWLGLLYRRPLQFQEALAGHYPSGWRWPKRYGCCCTPCPICCC